MHIPQTTPMPTVAHLTGVDLGLHNFVGLSWHVLLPYTLAGGCLMAYSQLKLAVGERFYKQDRKLALAKKPRSKAKA